MTQLSAEQKLRLTQSIREENKNNQMKMRRRESILFGTSMPAEELHEEPEVLVNSLVGRTGKGLGYGRFRMLIAILLFVGFVLLDMSKTNIAGMDSTLLYSKISEDFQSNLFDFMETIPYTLKE